MRVGMTLLCLLTGVIHPDSVLAQATPSPVQVQISAIVSGFRYERGSEAQWRGSTALRIRALVQEHFFGELSYATPMLSQGPVYCPGRVSCPPGTPDTKMTDRLFSVLGVGLGFRVPAGKWTPSLGVGRARFKSEGETPWGWMGVIGVERPLSGRWGMLAEYRGHRVEWPSDGLSWDHVIGLGVTFTH